MKIKNVKGEAVEACCSFKYKTVIISASTIFKPFSIVVIDDAGKIIYEATSIPDAIEWTDNNAYQIA
jgi:hypothetical protein